MSTNEGASIEEPAERLLRDLPDDRATPAEKRLAFLAAASQLLDESLDQVSTLARVVRLALPLLADVCILDLVDAEGKFRCVDTAHVVPHKDAVFARARGREPSPEGVRTRVLRSGEPRLIAEVDETALRAIAGSDAAHLGALRDKGLRSIVVVPLIARKVTFGVLTFAMTEQARRFTPADLTLAQQLAARAALAMDNARLHAEERRARVLAERTADRLAHVQTVTAALSTATTCAQVASVVLGEGAAVLGAEAGIVAVAADGGTVLEAVMSFGLNPLVPDGTRLPLDTPMPLAEAVRSRRPVLLDSPGSVLRCFPDFQRSATARPGGLVAVPLQVGDRILGAFQLCFPEGRHPRDIDREFLLTLAELVAQCLDRVRWYESAVQSEQRFRTLAEMLPQQVWIHAWPGKVEYFNERALQYLGISRDEALAINLESFIERFMHPDDQPRVRGAWERASQDRAMFEVEVRRRRADGVYRWHLNRAVPILDDQGKAVRWFGTATDIEDQKRTEAALKRSEGRLRRMTEIAVLGVGFFRPQDGTLTDANEAALAMIGYDREDLAAGRIDRSRLSPPEFRERDQQARAELARTGACTPYEKDLIRKDGSRVSVLHSAALLDSAGREGLVFFVDLTNRKRIERAHAELVERGRLFRERLVGIVSHDLRDPLGALVTALQLLKHQGARAPAEMLTIERMHRSLRRMTRMVSALLDFARSREGVGIPIQREAIDLGALCREVMGELSLAHPGRKLDLDVTGPVVGAWDGDRLAQVVSNLVSNALQHGDRGQPVSIRVSGTEASVCIEVHNHGTPIATADLDSLFDAFRTAQPPGARPAQNAGLGLYIVREIVLAHGGTVDARSSAGEGTVFLVRLPRHAPSAADVR